MRGIMGSMFGAMKIAVAAASVSLLLVVGGGCVSYTNVPEPSSAPAFKHANSGASIKSIVASLDRVILRHPMVDGSGRYAVNLPVGTTPETAATIVSRLPDGAMLPYEGMDGSVPVYHIGRIWLRGVSGKVDVVYPFVDADGQRVDGGVTVWVHGGNRPWYVKRMQYWSPGTVPVPLLYVPLGGDGEIEVMESNGGLYGESIADPAVGPGGDSVGEMDEPVNHQGDEKDDETVDEVYREIRG